MTVCQLRVGSGRTNWIWVWIESRGVFELWRLCVGYLRKDMAPEPQEAPSSGAELHPGNLLCKPWKFFLWLPKSNTKLVACVACPWLGHIDQTSWTSILWVDLFGYGMLQPDWEKYETRCSPRTRMLTRMLMVPMSKHMDTQSRGTLFWNSLFEQSCTFFPCYHTSAP